MKDLLSALNHFLMVEPGKTLQGKSNLSNSLMNTTNIYNLYKRLYWYKLSCNPEQSGYKMIANMKEYTIRCREDQTLCRRALCECDLEFATKITSFPDFDLSHNHTLLQRNGFDFEKSCPKSSLMC